MALFGKNNKTRFPAAAYTLAQGEQDELPVIAMINDGYKRYAFCRDYPWHVEIEIELADVNDVCLPTNEESAVLNALEDQIEGQMRNTGAVHHIARQTWNGTRMLDYYVEDGAAVEQLLAGLRDNGTSRVFKFTVKKDDVWENCAGFF